MEANNRLDQLDSLRGIAATSVILAHISIIIPSTETLENLNKTPLHLFWLGHESVILFFILSGFVLSLPYHRKKSLPYRDYLIRRVCRILIPSSVSLLLVLLIVSALSPNGLTGISQWGNDIWNSPISIKMIVDHLFLLGEFHTMKLNPVIWSLIHEMRISLLFPFIILLIKNGRFLKNAATVLAFPLLFFIAYYVGLSLFSYDITTFPAGYSSYLLTPHYTGFFLLGALLAKNKDRITTLYQKVAAFYKIPILLLGFLLYMYVWLVFPDHLVLHMFILNDWVIAFGSSIFIVFSLNSVTLKRMLLWKPVHFIGKISYSIYLYHLIVIMALLYSLRGLMPVALILIISFVLTFIVATIMYYLVEVPSVKLGRLLSQSNRMNSKGERKVYSERRI